MELLIKDRASINMQDVNGSTPLHAASLNGNDDVVSFLLEKGAIVDVPNRNLSTALDFASLNGLLLVKFVKKIIFIANERQLFQVI